jgi:hypothetical protein
MRAPLTGVILSYKRYTIDQCSGFALLVHSWEGVDTMKLKHVKEEKTTVDFRGSQHATPLFWALVTYMKTLQTRMHTERNVKLFP